MRVLIVTSIFPPDIGGPATYVPEVAASMVTSGMRASVVTLADDPGQHAPALSFAVTSIRRGMWRPWRWLLTILAIIRLGVRADVLYVNGLVAEAVLANMLLRKPMAQKVVGDIVWERATEKGWIQIDFRAFQERRCGLKIEFLKRLRGWWTRRADVVIVPSRFLGRCVAGWGVAPERIVVIPNAVRPLTDTPYVSIPLGTVKRIVCVGRLVRAKQIDRVIDVLVEVPDAGLVLVGDGPEREALAARAGARGVADRVFFAGRRSNDDVRAFMASCDVLVLNSSYEGLPHVVLEALATGLSVVATAVGGTPEVAESSSGVTLVPPGDRQALADALHASLASGAQPEKTRAERLGAARGAFRRMLDETERALCQCAGERVVSGSSVLGGLRQD